MQEYSPDTTFESVQTTQVKNVLRNMLIQKYGEVIGKKYWFVFYKCIYCEYTQKDVGTVLGVTVPRVQQILRKICGFFRYKNAQHII